MSKRSDVYPKRSGTLPKIQGHGLGPLLLLLIACQARWALPQFLPPANAVAVSPVEQVNDTVLFEDIKSPNRLYLPRFKLAEQTVSGEEQYRVRLTRQGSGADLEVYLEKYPAVEL